MTSKLLLLYALLVSTVIPSAQASDFEADGWYTWRVAAVDEAPTWCCLEWNGGNPTPTSCNLEATRWSWNSDCSGVSDAGEVQLYAQARNGTIVRVRALSPSCQVDRPERLTDLGLIDPSRSLTWIQPVVDDGESNALVAIAVHRGPEALALMTDYALQHDDQDVREDAIFWLGQVRSAESRDFIVDLMFSDEDPDIREQAAFSMSQSPQPDVQLLIRQGREDRNPDVRSQAWFWLALTGKPEIEFAIFEAIENDPDQDVREGGVFAISQLPDDRAVRNLMKIVEDGGMQKNIREKALFWLVQSDSDEADEVIDRLFPSSP